MKASKAAIGCPLRKRAHETLTGAGARMMDSMATPDGGLLELYSGMRGTLILRTFSTGGITHYVECLEQGWKAFEADVSKLTAAQS